MGLKKPVKPGLDTSDATATAQRILNGYTAYAQGEKITGNYVALDTSDATAAAANIEQGFSAYVNGAKVNGSAIIPKLYTGTVRGSGSTTLTITGVPFTAGNINIWTQSAGNGKWSNYRRYLQSGSYQQQAFTFSNSGWDPGTSFTYSQSDGTITITSTYYVTWDTTYTYSFIIMEA